MKKTIAIFLVAGITFMCACGPSAEEIAAMEKARQDSIQAVQEAAAAMEKARQDSIKVAEEAAMAMEKARQDSIAAAEEAAKKMKGKKAKKKEEPKKEEPKKAETGNTGKKGSETDNAPKNLGKKK